MLNQQAGFALVANTAVSIADSVADLESIGKVIGGGFENIVNDVKDAVQTVMNQEQADIHSRIEEPHRLLHQASAKIAEALKSNNPSKVLSARDELQKRFDDIRKIFDEYIQHLENRIIAE